MKPSKTQKEVLRLLVGGARLFTSNSYDSLVRLWPDSGRAITVRHPTLLTMLKAGWIKQTSDERESYAGREWGITAKGRKVLSETNL